MQIYNFLFNETNECRFFHFVRVESVGVRCCLTNGLRFVGCNIFFFHLLHPCVFILDVIRELKVTIFLSPFGAVGIVIKRIDETIVNILNNVVELLGQDNILAVYRMVEQRSYLLNPEASDAAANLRDQELILRMLFGKADELIHVWLDGCHSTLHRGDGIALTLQTYALPHTAPNLSNAIRAAPPP